MRTNFCSKIPHLLHHVFQISFTYLHNYNTWLQNWCFKHLFSHYFQHRPLFWQNQLEYVFLMTKESLPWMEDKDQVNQLVQSRNNAQGSHLIKGKLSKNLTILNWILWWNNIWESAMFHILKGTVSQVGVLINKIKNQCLEFYKFFFFFLSVEFYKLLFSSFKNWSHLAQQNRRQKSKYSLFSTTKQALKISI